MCLEFNSVSFINKSILHHVDHNNKKRRYFNQSRHETDVLLFLLRNSTVPYSQNSQNGVIY